MSKLARALWWLSVDVSAAVAAVCAVAVLLGVGGRAWPLAAVTAGLWLVMGGVSASRLPAGADG